MLLRLFFITLCLICTQSLGYAQSGGFPFLGEVVSEKVNVRAGQSTNFEKLCQILKGREVVVVAKEYSWYKIKLPLEANSFVADKYIQRLDNFTGVVTADRVNIRAIADVNTTSLGQITKGTTVKIVEHKNGWYRIQPMPESFGWVSEEFVQFKSKDISQYNDDLKILSLASESVVEVKKDSELIVTKIISTVGFLEPLMNPLSETIRYEIVVDGQPIYLLESTSRSLDIFSHYKVAVEGGLDTQPITSSLPVLIVNKVQLVL